MATVRVERATADCFLRGVKSKVDGGPVTGSHSQLTEVTRAAARTLSSTGSPSIGSTGTRWSPVWA